MNKKTIISLIIFLTIVVVLGIPFTQWWLYGADDFHAIFIAHNAKTWKQLFYFFYEGQTHQGQMGPSNTLAVERSDFLHTFYRPLYHIFHTLQYWLFGLNIYPYFLISIIIHALNSVILFNLLSLLVPLTPSLIGAFLFAFHPQIAFRFGQFVNQHYYINVLFTLLCVLFFIYYVTHTKKRYLFTSLLFFTLSLFTRESTIILPAALGLITLAFHKTYYPSSNFYSSLLFSFRKTYPFGLVALAFLLLRLCLYPFKKSSSASTSLLTTLTKKIPELKVFMYDFFTLSWLPWGHPTLRGAILIMLASIFIFLFIKNTKKLLTVSFLVGGLLLLWPGLPNPYNCRYFYEAYGFFLAGQLLLFTQHSLAVHQAIKTITSHAFLSLAGLYALFCFYNFKIRESKMITIRTAAYDLAHNKTIQGRPLCFVGHPLDGYADHFSQFFWLYLNNPNLPIYVDQTTIFTQADSNIFVSEKYFLRAADHFNQNYVTVQPVRGGFRLSSHNPSKIHFGSLNDLGVSLGEKIVHDTQILHGEKVVTDFSLIIDKKYLEQNPCFVTWDYEKKKFIVIDKSPV